MENAPVTPAAPAVKRGFPVWVIVVLVLLGVCIIVPVCVIVILALLGPAIGNVFSNVIQNIGTPIP